MSTRPRNKTSEVVGIVCLAAALLLAVSLVTYSPLDPSLSVSSAGRDYANRVGRIGAWVADFLLQVLGASAYLLPLPLAVVGYRKVRRRPMEAPFLKLLGLAIALAALSGILSLARITWPAAKFAPGGIVGIVLADRATSYLNRLGALIALCTVLVVSLVWVTRFSLNAVLDWVGEHRFGWGHGLLASFRQWRSHRRDLKQRAMLQDGKKALVMQPVPPQPAVDRKVAEAVDADSGPEIGEEDTPGADTEATESPRTLWRTLPERPKPESGLERTEPRTAPPYALPALDFLQMEEAESEVDEAELIDRAQRLTAKCAEFGVNGRVFQIQPGPVVTTFEFKPDPGIKYSRITSLGDDLCLALKAESVRIERIPGKNTVGIEVPNRLRRVIYLREILASDAFQGSRSKLTLALGKLIDGNTYVTDLTRMPHLLTAGATGSGKSVGLNIMVCSILYEASPSEVRFIMIDPKRLELGVYEGIPHLLTPIVTDPRQAANALNWAVMEMEERYRRLAQVGVRNIEQYNQLLKENPEQFEVEDRESLPYIVIIVDELADLMMTAGKEVEGSLTRLAQMARAIGIHLILATQRPSVDVLTGLIKANFPCRISYRVSSKVDSRTILDCNGAEQLLGQGDMLFLAPGSSRLIRIHGAFVSEREIGHITAFLKQQAEPQYQEEILAGEETEKEGGPADMADLDDELFEEAARFVVETGKASTSLLQRRLRVGYGRAARLLDMMERDGLIGPPDGSRPRDVLVGADYFDEPRRG